MSNLALITGATSGIGKAFAQRLASDGYDLIIVGRRQDRLEEFAADHPAATVRTVAADLSTGPGIDAVAQICTSEPLTMLVNNAGVAHYMPLAELGAAKARELVHVKVLAPTMRGLELGEVVCAPGVEDASHLDAVFQADLSAFAGQKPELASRYRAG